MRIRRKLLALLPAIAERRLLLTRLPHAAPAAGHADTPWRLLDCRGHQPKALRAWPLCEVGVCFGGLSIGRYAEALEAQTDAQT